MADESLIPAGIQDANTEALAALIERMGTLDLAPLLIYRIDSVEASALPHLAEQFHVLGFEGWNHATTEAERRQLVKRAIELHRHRGTPWAIKEALKAIGFASVWVFERVAHWTEFDVRAEGPLGDATLRSRSSSIVDAFKNLRSLRRDLIIVGTTTTPGAKAFGFNGDPDALGFGQGEISRSW